MRLMMSVCSHYRWPRQTLSTHFQINNSVTILLLVAPKIVRHLDVHSECVIFSKMLGRSECYNGTVSVHPGIVRLSLQARIPRRDGQLFRR
jgi:hypothetical protein